MYDLISSPFQYIYLSGHENADIHSIGVNIGGRNITDLRYADDTALRAHDLTSMKRILHSHRGKENRNF